ncbi:MAG: integration host factor subunit beta [Treponema sp.]|nr:integration host factor subunit beta [Treponema sp.]
MSQKKVTKYNLVESVYQKINIKCEKRVVQEVIENLLDQLKESLKDGATIELRGFGTFEPRLRKGRAKARNPKTGEQLSVAPHYVAAFRSGQELKKALWELPVEKVEKSKK